jgi:ribosomal-protein-alanine N-acetyltransferase
MYQTERIRIAPFRPEDLPHLVKLFCEEKSVMGQVLKGRLYTLQELLLLIAQEFVLSPDDQYGFWCIFHRETGKFMGIAGLIPCNYLAEEDFEFGFILRPEFWGQGLATEIGAFSVAYGRDHLQLPRLLATTSPRNLPSQRILQKLGLHFTKALDHPERGQRWLYQIDYPEKI